MVRSKSRWVVGEAEWTSKKRKGEPWNLQAFTDALNETVTGCWGSLGSACLLPTLRVVHLDKQSGVFILQVSRSCVRELLVSLLALSQVEGRGCRLHVLHVGGTLLKAKQKIDLLLHAHLAETVRALAEVETENPAREAENHKP